MCVEREREREGDRLSSKGQGTELKGRGERGGQQKLQGSAYQQPDLSEPAPLLGPMGGGGHKHLGGRGEMMGVGCEVGWDGAGVVN